MKGIKMIRVFETFSGIGAQTKALANTKVSHSVVATSEWDINAIISYANIHCKKEMLKIVIPSYDEMIEYLSGFTFSSDGKKPIKSIKRLPKNRIMQLYVATIASNNFGSISDISAESLPDFDLLTYSFPCQAISLQGKKEGLVKGSKTSSSLLWEVERILLELSEQKRLPKYLLMENVANLLSKNFIPFFNTWLDFLDSLGYKTSYGILTASDFNCPQNRNRAFAISVLGDQKIDLPVGKRTLLTLNDFVEDTSPQKYYLDHLLHKVDFKNKKVKNSGICSTLLKNYTTFQSENYVYFLNGISPTITANGAQSRLKIIDHKNKLRYLMPIELWRLMGFTDNDFYAAHSMGISEVILKKQAGNSICVPVLEAIFKKMFKNNK